MLGNLADTEWKHVHCGKKIQATLACRIDHEIKEGNTSQNINYDMVKSTEICWTKEIVVNEKCFNFVWFEWNASPSQYSFKLL